MSKYEEVKKKMEERAADMTPERMIEVAKHYCKTGGMTFPEDVTVPEAVCMVEYFDVGPYRVAKMGTSPDEIVSSICSILTGMLINLKDVDTYRALTAVKELESLPGRVIEATFEESPEMALLAMLETVLQTDVYDIPEEDIKLTQNEIEQANNMPEELLDMLKEVKEKFDL